MINLFEETMNTLTRYQKTLSDIAWIGGEDFYISLEDYLSVAKNTNYDAGYGSEEIATDLIIAFKDGSWLSRASYDGSEWFKYNVYPQKPKFKLVDFKLRSCDYKHQGTLADINFGYLWQSND